MSGRKVEETGQSKPVSTTSSKTLSHPDPLEILRKSEVIFRDQQRSSTGSQANQAKPKPAQTKPQGEVNILKNIKQLIYPSYTHPISIMADIPQKNQLTCWEHGILSDACLYEGIPATLSANYNTEYAAMDLTNPDASTVLSLSAKSIWVHMAQLHYVSLYLKAEVEDLKVLNLFWKKVCNEEDKDRNFLSLYATLKGVYDTHYATLTKQTLPAVADVRIVYVDNPQVLDKALQVISMSQKAAKGLITTKDHRMVALTAAIAPYAILRSVEGFTTKRWNARTDELFKDMNRSIMSQVIVDLNSIEEMYLFEGFDPQHILFLFAQRGAAQNRNVIDDAMHCIMFYKMLGTKVAKRLTHVKDSTRMVFTQITNVYGIQEIQKPGKDIITLSRVVAVWPILTLKIYLNCVYGKPMPNLPPNYPEAIKFGAFAGLIPKGAAWTALTKAHKLYTYEQDWLTKTKQEKGFDQDVTSMDGFWEAAHTSDYIIDVLRLEAMNILFTKDIRDPATGIPAFPAWVNDAAQAFDAYVPKKAIK